MTAPQYAWCPACKHSERVLRVVAGTLTGTVETQDTSAPVSVPCRVLRLACGHSVAAKVLETPEAR